MTHLSSPQIGIALAGGAARGIAHIGVLKALEEHNISPAFISGSSAGALVGAFYAAGKSPDEMMQIFKETQLLRLFKPALPTQGLADLSKVKDILAEHIPEDSFESLQRKLFVCVTNLTRGRFEICEKGALFEPVIASCSIPLLFRARELHGEMYVDGGLLNNLPVEPLAGYSDLLIGVNVTPIDYEEDLGDLFRIGYRTLGLVLWSNVESRLQLCDVVIEPPVDGYNFFDVNKADEIFEKGYEAAKAQLPVLLRQMGRHAEATAMRFTRPLRKFALFGSGQKEMVATQADKANLPPGSMFYLGKPRHGRVLCNRISFNETEVQEQDDVPATELGAICTPGHVHWIDVNGVHDVPAVSQICESFGLHMLTSEDIVNTMQRPKLEEHSDYLFAVLKMITLVKGEKIIDIEHISMVLSSHVLLSFQEKTEDVFDPLRHRIRENIGKVRKADADYLFYSVIDLIVSNYFVVLEEMDNRIEAVSERLPMLKGPEVMEEIQELKRGVLYLRRAVLPVRNLISELVRNSNRFVSKKTIPYFKDLEGQAHQLVDMLETQRDLLANLQEQYLALSSYKMNEIVKVLTIISSIFIPLTFIAGVYGMNFKYMPELEWRWGYAGALGIMAALFAGMVWYFKRRKWM